MAHWARPMAVRNDERERARFFAKVSTEPTPNGCLEWLGRKDHYGYGRFDIDIHEEGDNYPLTAHRVAYLFFNGEIPDGMYVLHTCDNPPCVNPEHLFLGTNQDNVDDMRRKGRGSDPPHYSGDAHPLRRNPKLAARGERCHLAKFTAEKVREIRHRLAAGERPAPIAKAFGVCISTICSIRDGKTWRHI